MSKWRANGSSARLVSSEEPSSFSIPPRRDCWWPLSRRLRYHQSARRGAVLLRAALTAEGRVPRGIRQSAQVRKHREKHTLPSLYFLVSWVIWSFDSVAFVRVGSLQSGRGKREREVDKKLRFCYFFLQMCIFPTIHFHIVKNWILARTSEWGTCCHHRGESSGQWFPPLADYHTCLG